MRNLGPVTRRRLAEIGITGMEQLSEVGSVQAFVRMRFVSPRGLSLNALHAMEAAILGCDSFAISRRKPSGASTRPWWWSNPTALAIRTARRRSRGDDVRIVGSATKHHVARRLHCVGTTLL